MPLNHKYTLVCDDVRREDNGKLIVVGMYTPGITLPKFPFRLSKLTFVSYFEVTEAGEWELAFRFSHVDTGAVVGGEGNARINVEQRRITTETGPVLLPITLDNVQFQMPGDYVFTMTGQNFEGVTVRVPVRQRPTPKVH